MIHKLIGMDVYNVFGFFFSGLDRIIYLSFATMTIDKVNVLFGMERV